MRTTENLTLLFALLFGSGLAQALTAFENMAGDMWPIKADTYLDTTARPAAQPEGSATDEAGQRFVCVSRLSTGRQSHGATLLCDGRVLIAGGVGGFMLLRSAELFDPTTRSMTPTGNMLIPRQFGAGNAPVTLPNSNVLLTGGSALSFAELYDPSTGVFSLTGAMHAVRWNPSVTLLPNGKVLVAGGYNDRDGYQSSAELYDPSIGTFSFTGSMHETREAHLATLLLDGRVLISGGNGSDDASAELYDPETQTFTLTGRMNEPHSGPYQTATLLADGRVLVTGFFQVEIYDPAEGAFTTIVNGIEPTARTATRLDDGKVLLVPGVQNPQEAALFCPDTGQFAVAGTVCEFRILHSASLLLDGNVLLAGGAGFGPYLDSVELYLASGEQSQ